MKDPSSYSELAIDFEKLTQSQKLRAMVYLIEEERDFSGDPSTICKYNDNYLDNDLIELIDSVENADHH